MDTHTDRLTDSCSMAWITIEEVTVEAVVATLI
jgi:hypothetical protein